MFSLTRGGPFYHLMRRCRLVDANGRIRPLPLVLVTWIPLFAATIVEVFIGGRTDTPARDPVMHVRLLVTLPLLFFAENLLDARCAGVVNTIRRDSIVERATLDAIVARAEQLRDSWLVEAGLAIAVLLFGQLALWGIGEWGALVSSYGIRIHITFGTLWCVSFALPLVQFLILRWLWWWGVWTYMIVRIARAPLSLNTIHPDRAGGIKAMSTPVDGFAVFVAAVEFISSTAWTIQIHHKQTTMPSVTPTFVAYVVAAFAVSVGPLLLFVSPLYRARFRDTVALHGVARRYVDEFRRKWIVEPSGESPLGSSDIQSLNDIGGSFRTSEETKLVPFGTRTVVNLWVSALVPVVPVLLMSAPLHQVAIRFGKMFFGL
jgi:hypothetical protein